MPVTPRQRPIEHQDQDIAMLSSLKKFMVASVAGDQPDLTARQFSVYLTAYTEDVAQTVRGLAALLNVSKPAITRALDRLAEFDLIRRKQDPEDRRSVLVQRTAAGQKYLQNTINLLRQSRG